MTNRFDKRICHSDSELQGDRASKIIVGFDSLSEHTNRLMKRYDAEPIPSVESFLEGSSKDKSKRVKESSSEHTLVGEKAVATFSDKLSHELTEWMEEKSIRVPNELLDLLIQLKLLSPQKVLNEMEKLMNHVNRTFKKLQIKRVEKFFVALKNDFETHEAMKCDVSCQAGDVGESDHPYQKMESSKRIRDLAGMDQFELMEEMKLETAAIDYHVSRAAEIQNRLSQMVGARVPSIDISTGKATEARTSSQAAPMTKQIMRKSSIRDTSSHSSAKVLLHKEIALDTKDEMIACKICGKWNKAADANCTSCSTTLPTENHRFHNDLGESHIHLKSGRLPSHSIKAFYSPPHSHLLGSSDFTPVRMLHPALRYRTVGESADPRANRVNRLSRPISAASYRAASPHRLRRPSKELFKDALRSSTSRPRKSSESL